MKPRLAIAAAPRQSSELASVWLMILGQRGSGGGEARDVGCRNTEEDYKYHLLFHIPRLSQFVHEGLKEPSHALDKTRSKLTMLTKILH